MHPILFHLGRIAIPTFGLLAVLGLLSALQISLRTAVMCRLAPDALWDAGIFAVMLAFVASRVLLVVTNFASFRAAPLLLLTVPSLTTGGLLLTALGTAIYLHRRHLGLLRALDAWTSPGLLLWGALALGHLAEGSDPGMPAARFGLRSSLAGYREQPVALYAAAVALVLAVLLFRFTKRPHTPGHVAALGLALGGIAQFALSFLRLPYLYAQPTGFALLDPIEWVALGLVALGGAVIVASGWTTQSDTAPPRFGAEMRGEH